MLRGAVGLELVIVSVHVSVVEGTEEVELTDAVTGELGVELAGVLVNGIVRVLDITTVVTVVEEFV